MSNAAVMQAALPGHTAKRLARLVPGLSLRTARHWLYCGPAAGRRRELARALLAEMDRQDAEERARAREALRAIAGEGG